MQLFFKILAIGIVICSVFLCGMQYGANKTHNKQKTYSHLNKRVNKIEEALMKQYRPLDVTECPDCYNGLKTAMKYETMELSN